MDLWNTFDQFHSFASRPHNFASFFVTLIPKVKNPCSLGEFQKISLIGSLYKLVAKFLANWLWLVMDKLISPNQSTFLKGRMLVDGVATENEAIDLAKCYRNVILIFKVIF